MARKPRIADVDPQSGETATLDTDTVTMPQPNTAKATDAAQSNDPNDSTALSTGTVATIGDNQPDAAEPLPDATTVHNNILSVVGDINRHADAQDRSTQRLAYLLGQRHAVLQGMREAGSIKPLSALADDAAAFNEYWEALLLEFVGPAIRKFEAETEKDAQVYMSRQTWNNRCMRAFNLIVNLAWCGIDYTAFNHDKGQFPCKPIDLCPHGNVPGLELAWDKAANAPRTIVWLGDDTGRTPYYIGWERGKQYAVNASINQLNHATASRAAALRNAKLGKETEPSQATAGKAKRAAATAGETQRTAAAQAEAHAQAEADRAEATANAAKLAAAAVVAGNKAAEAAEVAATTPTELGEMPTDAAGIASRAKVIERVNAALIACEAALAHDEIQTVEWLDMSEQARNAFAIIVAWHDRLKHDDEPDTERPAKRATA